MLRNVKKNENKEKIRALQFAINYLISFYT